MKQMKRRERFKDEFMQELRRDSQLLQLWMALEDNPQLTVRPDGVGACLFKVYLPGQNGPKQGFLRAMTPLDKSYVDWSQQLPACRNAFASVVKSARNKDGSQFRLGISVDEVVKAVLQFVAS